MPFQTRIYKTQDGRIPFEETLAALRDIRAKVAVMRRIQRAQLGNLGDHHSIGAGLHEMRIDYGPGYRIYYSWEGAALIILFLVGTKSAQEADILAASRYLSDLRSRQ